VDRPLFDGVEALVWGTLGAGVQGRIPVGKRFEVVSGIEVAHTRDLSSEDNGIGTGLFLTLGVASVHPRVADRR
jgi:hypothetical protein